jgi:arginase
MPGTDLPTELANVIAGRPVYVHVDCDVLNPGTPEPLLDSLQPLLDRMRAAAT